MKKNHLFFPKIPLRVRLTAWYVFLLALTLIIFSSYLYVKLQQNLIKQIDEFLAVTATELIDSYIENAPIPHFYENKETAEHLQGLLKQHFIGRIITSDGKVTDSFNFYQSLPLVIPKNTGYMNLPIKINEEITTWRTYNIKLSVPDTWLQLSQLLNPTYRVSNHLLTLMLLGFPLMLLIAGGGGWLLAYRALRPLHKIMQTANKITANDLTERIIYEGPTDELSHLTNTINQMLDRLQAGFEYEHRFTADVSHELRTPLSVIKGRIGVTLSRERSVSEYQKNLQEIEQETDRLIRLTNGLLYLARLEQEYCQHSFWQCVDFSNLLTTLAEQMLPLAEIKSISLISNIESNLFVLGNSDYLNNLFLNLIDNALKYTDQGGKISIKVYAQEKSVLAVVANTGAGISSEHLPHLFERFYRVESARSRSNGGVGLGLAISSEIARLHGGTLTVASKIGEGTSFLLTLPKGC